MEVLAQRGRGAEARGVRDAVHRQVAVLQQLPGPFDALPGQPALRRHPGLLAEPARERPHAHGLLRRQLGQRQRPVQVLQRVGAGPARGVQAGGGHGTFDELRLPAVPVRGHHGAAGHRIGHGRAEVRAHQVQAQVDPRGDARRGQHPAVLGVEDVRVEPHPRVQRAEPVARRPVRRRAAAVEQPGRGQHERAGADRRDARVRPYPLQGGGERLRQPARSVRLVPLVRRGNDHGVGLRQRLGAVPHLDGEVRARAHRPGGDRARHHLVQRGARR